MDLRKWRDSVVAAGSRLSLRRYRNFGDSGDLERHKEYRAELERRGHTEQFGVFGWDDGITSPDAR